jgi:AraC family transcriptional regulator
MDGHRNSRRGSLSEALTWIEANLDAPLTLEAIAGRTGLSPYHFSRLFTAHVGVSVMAHVRARKLTMATRRLRADPGLRLIDLAFDCGFESQAAFTRAFKRVHGVAPGRFRGGLAAPLTEGAFVMTEPDPVSADVIQLPELKRREALSVAGVSHRYDAATKASIPDLWPKLIARMPFEGQAPSWDTYGVVWSADRTTGVFTYLAGAGLAPGAATPQGLERIELPAGAYAVFRITLTGGALHPQIKASMATIWGELIPTSGLTLTGGPDFELYDGRFSPTRPGAVIDFYVPVEG